MGNNFYETDRAVSEYLLLHYGEPETVLPYNFGPAEALDFPIRCLRQFANKFPATRARALDLGCSVGAAAFELARHFGEVMGIDYSEHFVAVAQRLQVHGEYAFSFCVEGEITAKAVARVPAGIERNRVCFQRGDAHDLPSDLGQFDLVLMANLIDRLKNPRACLQQLGRFIRPGGQLILTSPYTWTTDYTPQENWLGGYMQDGQPLDTFGALKEVLSNEFTLLECKDLPMLIREHARKFQWCVAQASLWERKGR